MMRFGLVCSTSAIACVYALQVRLNGFKSYKHEITTDDFSPKLNVVVGANGSGKSNFFDEIVFDNSDERIPLKRNEVRISRTFGPNKDEFHVDGKRQQKEEVRSLLESAGLSSSNTYHVVSQGRVNEIATMRPERRLEMLKEIGGTTVYENKRQESVKNLEDSERKREQIEESMRSIEEKLNTLDSEKAELAAWERLDKQRRALQYCLYSEESRQAEESLRAVEQQQQESIERKQTLSTTLAEKKQEACERENEATTLESELNDCSQKVEAPRNRQQTVYSEKQRLQSELSELDEQIQRFHDGTQTSSRSLQDVQELIDSAEARRDRLQEQIQQKHQAESQLHQEKEQKERQLKDLRNKQGRAAEFSTAAERDQWLNTKIQQLSDAIARQQKEVENLQHEISTQSEEKRQIEDSALQCDEKAQSLAAHIQELDKEQNQLHTSMQEQQERRRSLWQQQRKIEDEYSEACREFNKADDELRNAMPRDVGKGLRAMEEIVREQQIDGVYGKLCDIIECDEKLNDAVEVVGNQSLFNVVVEDDSVSAQIIDQLNRRRAGRITTMPLNCVRGGSVSRPESSHDALPLADYIRCEDRFRTAVEQVFGKSLFCRDIDVATRVANEYGVDTVTIDGQQVARKGGLTGGFKDPSRSKLALMKRHKQLASTRVSKGQELEQIKQQLNDVNNNYDRLRNEFEHKRSERDHTNMEAKQNKESAEQQWKHAEQIGQRIQQAEEKVSVWKQDLQKNQDDVQAFKAELGMPLQSDLSAEETNAMPRLQHEITELATRINRMESERTEIEKQHQTEQNLLENNLYKRKERVQSESSSEDFGQKQRERQDKARELSLKEAELTTLEAEINDLEGKIDELQQQIRGRRKENERANNEFAAAEDEMNQLQLELDSLQEKQRVYEAAKQSYVQHISELGSPPEQAHTDYAHWEKRDLEAQLQWVTKELQQYKDLNKKALLQHSTFVSEKETLKQRVQEVNQAKEKIQELIDLLDHKKDDAIQTTFKQVAQQFQNAFSILVPGGSGELKWQYRSEDLPEAEQEEFMSPLRYTGVDIKVRFSSDVEATRIEQLSGGQKTVVALAFMFAIQRTDAAPFYIFDEIDAALDHNYRRAVAKLIQAQAESDEENNGSQFIATTFGHDMVDSASQVFGVGHQNRISSIEQISHSQAKEFLQERQQAQLQAQEGATVANGHALPFTGGSKFAEEEEAGQVHQDGDGRIVNEDDSAAQTDEEAMAE